MKMNTSISKAIFAIIILFAIGLVFFFLFAAPYGDGLERTMEEGEVSESEPEYSAPMDYGDNYVASLIAGLVGFAVVLIAMLLLLKYMRKKDETQEH
jgi:Na+/proline symporter